MSRILITGASGVLGSAIHNAFTSSGDKFQVLALSHTKSGQSWAQLDLLDFEKTDKLFSEFKPNWIIHCAAERRPDVAEKDPERTEKLNVDVPAHLASIAKSLGNDCTLVYISTDYVFDGTSPPYTPSATTNPLNLYGRTKRGGEEAVLSIDGAKVVVLRVPVLYGPAPNNSDSAVNILLDTVLDQSGKTYKMDHYATRYPTNVIDIANFLVQIVSAKTLPRNKSISLPPIIHFSGAQPYTKYEMCLVFASILGVSHKHIVPQADPPKESETPRPRDTKLYTKETEDLVASLGIQGGVELTLFEEWWGERLKAGA